LFAERSDSFTLFWLFAPGDVRDEAVLADLVVTENNDYYR
jgi:hypothetical protein